MCASASGACPHATARRLLDLHQRRLLAAAQERLAPALFDEATPATDIDTLLEEEALRVQAALRSADAGRLDALPLAAAPIAALAAGELLALTHHLRPRRLPSEEPSAPAVAERVVQMSAAELRELGQRLRERLAPASAET